MHSYHKSKKSNSINKIMPKLHQLLNFANNMESDEVTSVIRRGAAASSLANRNNFGFQAGMNTNKSQRLNSLSMLVDGNR